MATKVVKGIGKVLTEPNTIANGGGLSSILIPRRLTGTGAAVVVGGIGALNLANEGVKSRNRAILGKVSYVGGPARMTQSYTSGAVEAMHRASGGNYAVFSEMAEGVMTRPSIGGIIENHGATPELVAALYNMGGR